MESGADAERERRRAAQLAPVADASARRYFAGAWGKSSQKRVCRCPELTPQRP